MRVCPSVRPSVCPCVRVSVRPLAFKRNRQKRRFQPARRILLPAGACFFYEYLFPLNSLITSNPIPLLTILSWWHFVKFIWQNKPLFKEGIVSNCICIENWWKKIYFWIQKWASQKLLIQIEVICEMAYTFPLKTNMRLIASFRVKWQSNISTQENSLITSHTKGNQNVWAMRR